MALMTPKQLLFAEHYALDHNGAAAAVRAGYARRSARQIASELLAKPDVEREVAKFEEEASRPLQITKELVIVEPQEAIELARQQDDPGAMIRGWAQIARLIGAYAPERKKIEISLDGEALRAQFAGMSDAELLAITEEEELSS